PSRPVRAEDEPTGFVETRLDDRLVVTTGHDLDVFEADRRTSVITANGAEEQLRSIPGHPRMIPAQPGDLVTVDLGGMKEIGVARQDDDPVRIIDGRPVEGYGHEFVDGLAVALDRLGFMGLAQHDEPVVIEPPWF